MKKILLGNFLVIILVLGFLYVLPRKTTEKQGSTVVTLPTTTSVEDYESQTDSQGEVEIEITPQTLSAKDEVKFNLTFTTHSVDLAFDVAKISHLEDEQGNIYRALNWTGGSGGHHLVGILSFPKVSEKSKTVTLTISQVDKIDRIFKWDL